MIARAVILLAALCAAAPTHAALSQRDLARAVAKPPAGATLPGSLSFTDQRGMATTLGAVADGAPLVLIFADFTCRHVCAPALAMTSGALSATGLSPGRDYRLAVVGIDPNDTPADARHLAQSAGTSPVIARATALLAGDAANVRAATGALGYGYVYDAANDQFAHDAAVYVFGRDGRFTALLPELALQPAALRAALTGAEPARPSLAERVAHLCYGFAAAQGRFGRPVVIALQALSLLLLASVGVLVWRRRRA